MGPAVFAWWPADALITAGRASENTLPGWTGMLRLGERVRK